MSRITALFRYYARINWYYENKLFTEKWMIFDLISQMFYSWNSLRFVPMKIPVREIVLCFTWIACNRILFCYNGDKSRSHVLVKTDDDYDNDASSEVNSSSIILWCLTNFRTFENTTFDHFRNEALSAQRYCTISKIPTTGSITRYFPKNT